MTMKRSFLVAHLVIGMAGALALVNIGWGQQAPIAAAHELKLGDPAPAFELPSHSGDTVALKDLLKDGPVAVVFHRSADW